MNYDIVAAIIAGLAATVAMTAVMYMGRGMLPQQMPMNILYLLGTMVTTNTGVAYVIGTMMHVVNGIVFAIIHTALYQAFGLETGLVLWGLLFGAAHWLISGMGMGMIGGMHQLIRSGKMQAPGVMVMNLPMMNVMGFLMVHLLFGLVVGAVYEGLA